MALIPMVIEKTYEGERSCDIFSRLLNDRIIMLTGEINDQMASSIIAQLLYLESVSPHEDISLYINSPGGSISAGFAIYDTMHYISCDVSTICLGMAASMGAFILSSGAYGKRCSLPNAEIMIHQPMGGSNGQASDMVIAAQRIQQQKEKLAQLLAQQTNQSLDTILRDTDRDHFMTAQEAQQYGLIDRILLKHHT